MGQRELFILPGMQSHTGVKGWATDNARMCVFECTFRNAFVSQLFVMVLSEHCFIDMICQVSNSPVMQAGRQAGSATQVQQSLHGACNVLCDGFDLSSFLTPFRLHGLSTNWHIGKQQQTEGDLRPGHIAQSVGGAGVQSYHPSAGQVRA